MLSRLSWSKLLHMILVSFVSEVAFNNKYSKFLNDNSDERLWFPGARVNSINLAEAFFKACVANSSRVKQGCRQLKQLIDGQTLYVCDIQSEEFIQANTVISTCTYVATLSILFMMHLMASQLLSSLSVLHYNIMLNLSFRLCHGFSIYRTSSLDAIILCPIVHSRAVHTPKCFVLMVIGILYVHEWAWYCNWM